MAAAPELLEVLISIDPLIYAWVNEKDIDMEEYRRRSAVVDKYELARAKAEGRA